MFRGIDCDMIRLLGIAVISHRSYRVLDDLMCLPFHVGAVLYLDTLVDRIQDNTGNNVSSRSAKYSELTGLSEYGRTITHNNTVRHIIDVSLARCISLPWSFMVSSHALWNLMR